MKSWLPIIFIFIAIIYWQDIALKMGPPPDVPAQHNDKVVMYSASWCGYCKKMRKLFNDNNIAFLEYDIETSREGRQQYDKLRGKVIPLVLIKGEVIRGYRPKKVMSLLEDA